MGKPIDCIKIMKEDEIEKYLNSTSSETCDGDFKKIVKFEERVFLHRVTWTLGMGFSTLGHLYCGKHGKTPAWLDMLNPRHAIWLLKKAESENVRLPDSLSPSLLRTYLDSYEMKGEE